jgi:hypothetical protein
MNINMAERFEKKKKNLFSFLVNFNKNLYPIIKKQGYLIILNIIIRKLHKKILKLKEYNYDLKQSLSDFEKNNKIINELVSKYKLDQKINIVINIL